MFDIIGKFASRFRYPILITWLLAVVLVTLLAPNLSNVTIAEQSSFLNPNSPSLAASKIAEKYFPGQASSGSAVLVLHSNNGPLQDNPAAQAYLTDLTSWLKTLDPTVVHSILSPVDDPTLASQMISKDGLVAIISVGITGSMDNTAVNNTIKEMQKRLKDTPEGLDGYVTGGLAIAHDYKSGALSSAAKTTLITVVLVIAILLMIYRSPILPFVPLATIGIAYGISRGMVATLATVGWTLSSFTDVFMVVLLFGAGTDYCLFIVSRFREYMADEVPATEAARNTIAKVGETITSSAGTVIVGTMAMYFVELKIFANSGPSLAIGVFITLLAGLTFTPALLAVLGRRAFWPGKPRHADTRALWGRLANWVAAKPWLPLLIALVVLVPLGVYGLGFGSSFDMLADLPSSVPAKAGFTVLSDHFGSGEMQPLEVVTTNIPNARTPQGIAFINALTQQLLSEKGVADVRSLTLPAGKESAEITDALRVDRQLAMIADGIQSLDGLGSDPSGLAAASNGNSLSSFGSLSTYLAELGQAFTDLASNSDYQNGTAALERLQNSYLIILYQMPVKDQLAMIQSILTQALASSGGSTANSTQSLEQLTMLGDYLKGLGETLPAVTGMDGYADAMKALAEIENKVVELSKGMVVSAQLEMIASRFEETAKALETDPTAMQPEEGQPTPAEQMDALRAYLEELGAAYPELKATTDYTTALSTVTMMAAAAQSGTQGSTDQSRLALNGLSQSFRNMATIAAQMMPEATFVPQTSLPGMDASTLMGNSLTDFSQALTRLQAVIATQLPEATYIPNDMTPEQLQAGMAALQTDMATLGVSLHNLAQTFAGRQDNFFVPLSLASGTEAESLTRLLDTYTSATGDAARLQVILADQPYSSAAIDTVARLRDTVEKADHGYIYSGTAVLYDLRDAMARDMRKVMLLTLSGIAVVMVLLLRSLVAPLYLMATILLSYGSTLGITRLVFDGFMNIKLTWFVPLFIFTMLMSLGMDYNIFLMGRVKEETDKSGTRAGIHRAMARTGGIITSAGVIMAGTFAAMLSSSLVGLVQLAFAITVGVLLDTFVIRTTLVPAIGMLLGKWNWWPRRGKK